MEKKLKQIDLYRNNLIITDPDDPEMLGDVQVSRVIMNEDGQEIERITYDIEGEAEERVLIVYKDGKPVEEILEMAGEIAERTTRSFDEQGRMSVEYRHYLEGEPDEIRYTYNEEGKLVQRLLTDSDGEEGEKQVWIYEQDKLVREESWNEYGDLEISKTFTYSEDGTPEETVELSFLGGEETRLVTLYDDEGVISTEKRYDARGRLVSRQIITQGENGHTARIEEETVAGKTITTLEYDDAGNNTVHEETAEDGTRLTRIERQFNADGRLTGSEVWMENTLRRPGQHYQLRYEYTYFE
ncbi:MAG: hypothetical protein M9948_00735 [Lentimicrobium sp.]|nr:hypothetical protein [Lentimicrobium sp.]